MSVRRKKKPIEEITSPPEQELLLRMQLMREPYRSHAAFTYLFGNRVSEPTNKDLPLFKTNIHIESDILYVDNIVTLKRKKGLHPRLGYVLMKGNGEEGFIQILMEFIEKKQDLEPLWTHSRKTQWYYVDKFLGIPPHKLRGMRATKDSVQYDLDAIDLKKKFNWATDGMAMHYAAKNPKDIIQKMVRATKSDL